MRVGAVIVVIWLVIGALAAYQRNYFSSEPTNCAQFTTVLLTIAVGPLNYLGVTPGVESPPLPQPPPCPSAAPALTPRGRRPAVRPWPRPGAAPAAPGTAPGRAARRRTA